MVHCFYSTIRYSLRHVNLNYLLGGIVGRTVVGRVVVRRAVVRRAVVGRVVVTRIVVGRVVDCAVVGAVVVVTNERRLDYEFDLTISTMDRRIVILNCMR